MMDESLMYPPMQAPPFQQSPFQPPSPSFQPPPHPYNLPMNSQMMVGGCVGGDGDPQVDELGVGRVCG